MKSYTSQVHTPHVDGLILSSMSGVLGPCFDSFLKTSLVSFNFSQTSDWDGLPAWLQTHARTHIVFLPLSGYHGWLRIHEPNGHLYIGRLSIYVWFDYIAGKQGINKPPREGPVLTPAMSRQAPTSRGLGRWADKRYQTITSSLAVPIWLVWMVNHHFIRFRFVFTESNHIWW